MSDSRKSAGAAPSRAYDPLGTLGGGAQALQPLVKSASRINLELAGFASNRARAWVETSAALMRCRTPEDVLRTQLDFFRDAGQEWLATGRRIGEAWQQVFDASGREPASKPARRDFIDLSDTAETDAPPASRNGHAPRRTASERRTAA